jgi:hypothetical protein
MVKTSTEFVDSMVQKLFGDTEVQTTYLQTYDEGCPETIWWCYPQYTAQYIDPPDIVTVMKKVAPPSCTYERYSTRKGCGMRLPLEHIGVEIKATLAKCPNSRVPYVSIKCAGDGCIDIFKTCSDDGACGGASNSNMKCQGLADSPTTKYTYDFLREAGLFNQPFESFETLTWYVF